MQNLKVIGKSEPDAIRSIKDAGMTSRIVYRDGIFYVVTRDYRLDRVNLHVVAGKVTKASIG